MGKAPADCITTYTGKYFNPIHPNPKDLCIDDIAHSLSLICRGNGHVSCFYSVAEHCINCALEAQERGYSKRVVLGCLLHDASESYMSDVPRPFKQFLKDYQVIEERLLSCIYQKFLGTDLTRGEQAQIKEIDNDVLAYDLYYLLHEGEEEELPELKRRYTYGGNKSHKIELSYRQLYHRFSEMLPNCQA
ncbi:MAG: hypothetical protein PHN80_12155 [Hespellia sp.]|nr:hypothetical protein [Hespellia sp.]